MQNNDGNDMESMLKEEKQCPICVEEFTKESEVVALPCNEKHIYHARCIEQWLRRHNTCPLCKVEVLSGGLVQDQNNNHHDNNIS